MKNLGNGKKLCENAEIDGWIKDQVAIKFIKEHPVLAQAVKDAEGIAPPSDIEILEIIDGKISIEDFVTELNEALDEAASIGW